MRVGIRIVWIAATTVGCALGLTLSSVLAGATARPLSPVLGGIGVVLLYGAVVGAVIGIMQLLVIPRDLIPWHLWVPVTLIGGAVGFALAAVVGEVLGNVIDPMLSVVIGEGTIETSSGAILGLAIGAGQWRVLRRRASVGRGWLVMCAIGGGLGYGAATAVLELFDVPILKTNLLPSFGAILGICIGTAQAPVLWSRRRNGSTAGRPG